MIIPFIKSIGCYVPEKTVSNDDFAKILETSDEWIYSHTGIKNRHFAAENENNSDLAHKASVIALERAGLSPDEIDLILVATTTPDYLSFPSTACILQDMLGASKAGALDIAAACSGFIYGTDVAANYVKSGAAQNVLVVGSELLTRVTNMKDRNTAVLFGDGAGAIIVSARPENNPEYKNSSIIASYLRSDGSGAEYLIRKAGGTKTPFSTDLENPNDIYISMNGRRVYYFAIKAIIETIDTLLEKGGITFDRIKYIVPHQANLRIIEGVSGRTGIPLEKFYLNIDKFANTSSASIPIALNEAIDNSSVKRGDYIITVGFGGGLTYGGSLIRW